MGPYVDGNWPEKKLFVYCAKVAVKRYGKRFENKHVTGFIAAYRETDATDVLKDQIVQKHLSDLKGAIEYTRITVIDMTCMDIDEIALPLGQVSEEYRKKVCRIVAQENAEAA